VSIDQAPVIPRVGSKKASVNFQANNDSASVSGGSIDKRAF